MGPGLAGDPARVQLTRWNQILWEWGAGGLAGKAPPLKPVPTRAHSLGGIDPNDVQVAVVDALLVLVGEARAAPGSAMHRASLGRLRLPRAFGAWTLHCLRRHSLLDVPFRSGCRSGPGYPASASISRLGARHQSCRRQIEGLLISSVCMPPTLTDPETRERATTKLSAQVTS